MQASKFGGIFDQLFLWIFLCNFHRKCLCTSSIPYCKKSQKWQKTQIKGSCLDNSKTIRLPNSKRYIFWKFFFLFILNKKQNDVRPEEKNVYKTCRWSVVRILRYYTLIYIYISEKCWKWDKKERERERERERESIQRIRSESGRGGTVKPVQNDHPLVQTEAVFVDRWSLFVGFIHWRSAKLTTEEVIGTKKSERWLRQDPLRLF